MLEGEVTLGAGWRGGRGGGRGTRQAASALGAKLHRGTAEAALLLLLLLLPLGAAAPGAPDCCCSWCCRRRRYCRRRETRKPGNWHGYPAATTSILLLVARLHRMGSPRGSGPPPAWHVSTGLDPPDWPNLDAHLSSLAQPKCQNAKS